MKSLQRNAVLTLSALALATTFAGIALLAFDQPSPQAASRVEPAAAAQAPATSVPTVRPTDEAERRSLDQRTADEQASGLFSAAPGTRLAFDVSNTGSSTMSNREGAVFQSFEVLLRGELAIDVLARRADEMAFTVRFPQCTLDQRIDGKAMAASASEALAASLARPVVVRAKVDGTLLGLRFDSQAQPEERNRVRTLLGALMPVAQEPLRESWEAEQLDPAGKLRCAYRLAGADASRVEIERISREYIEMDPTHPVPQVSGTARFGIDRGLGWFDSVVSDEVTTIEVELANWMVLAKQSTRCTLTGVRRDGPVGIDWDASWDSVSGAADAARVAESSREQELRESLNGRSIDRLVEELNALLAAGDPADPALVRLREQIGFLLSIDAFALERVAELVLDPRLSPDAIAALIDCVGRAGTPEAQALLAQWIADGDRGNDFRAESVYALIEVKQPGDNVVEAVAGLLGTDVDPQLQGSALLTMGALANIGGSHTQAGSMAFLHVMNWKQSAEASGRLPEWIEALGNTGSPQVVEAVKPYLGHEDSDVRASAVHALRLVFTLEVSQLAAQRGQEDAADNVRARAAEVLGARVDAHARAAIAAMLEGEPVADVRHTLILYLGALAANDAGARALLQDAAATDPSPEVREAALQQLSGVHHG